MIVTWTIALFLKAFNCKQKLYSLKSANFRVSGGKRRLREISPPPAVVCVWQQQDNTFMCLVDWLSTWNECKSRHNYLTILILLKNSAWKSSSSSNLL